MQWFDTVVEYLSNNTITYIVSIDLGDIFEIFIIAFLVYYI